MKILNKIILKLLLLSAIMYGWVSNVSGQAKERSWEELKEYYDKNDKMSLRYARGVVTDSSSELLDVPAFYGTGKRDFIMAQEAPVIDFAPVRNLYPEYEVDGRGGWSLWGETNVGPNGCFYFGAGNHRKGYTNNYLYLIEYDPAKKEQRIAVDVGRALGWDPKQYTETMLHGNLAFLPDGRLVAATWLGHEGETNLPLQAVESNWRGAYVFTYDVNTGMVDSHGIPMMNATWAMHNLDVQSGVLMAVGIGYAEGYPDPRWNNTGPEKRYKGQHYFLAYDVLKRKTLYAGIPPGKIDLSERGALIDHRTGLFYSTDSHNDHNFVCYDQFTNRWRDLKCKAPKNPATGEGAILRAWTYRATPDGAYYCMNMSGTFFKFYPHDESVELIGVDWGKEGVYTASLAMSPGYRYIYYLPDAHGHHAQYEQPVVQYDTRTKKKKVIAFLSPLYREKYGYETNGAYGIELSEDGSLLVVAMNGRFGNEEGYQRYSHPSIFSIHIPASERIE